MKEYMLSQTEFAKKLSVDIKSYNNWEREISRPKLEIAFEIANKLNRKVDEIWYLE